MLKRLSRRLISSLSTEGLARPSRIHDHEQHARSILHTGQMPAYVVDDILKDARKFKRNSQHCKNLLASKTVAFVVGTPSIRARLSFEVAATELGGRATTYFVEDLPADLHSATLPEAALVISLYADCLALCLDSERDLLTVAKYSQIPVINAEDTQGNPCEILSDLMTITEERGSLTGLKIAYLGDLASVRTYEMVRASCLMGMHMTAVDLYRQPGRLMKDREEAEQECRRLGHEGSMQIIDDPIGAIAEADVVMADLSSALSFDVGRLSISLVRALIDRAEKGALLLGNLSPEQASETIVARYKGGDRIEFCQTQNRLFIEKALLRQLITSPQYQSATKNPRTA